MDARRYLLDLIMTDTPFNHTYEELLSTRLEAAQNMFQQQIECVPVLKKRAEETGIREIVSLNDLVPLLFAHTVYKSYPESFVGKNNWKGLNAWLSTISADDYKNVNVEGVKDADDWIKRLAEYDTVILATSGTSGKCSFVPNRFSDRELKFRHFGRTVGWPDTMTPTNDWLYFWSGPLEGPSTVIEGANMAIKLWAKPDGLFAMMKEPLRISEVSAMAAFSRKMAEGKATPSEIAEFQAKSKATQERSEKAFEEYIDLVLKHRNEPMILSGLWSQMTQIIDRAHELGIPDGDFHPDSRVQAGGGQKATGLPPDFKERFDAFFCNTKKPALYSMTENTQIMPRCEANHYHIAPGLIALVVDVDGEKIVEPDESGVASGRFAFLDLLLEGRWGGLISGDKVDMDYSPTCQCGRPGPVILDTITRYAPPGQADHIGCAGTIDSYVKGALTE